MFVLAPQHHNFHLSFGDEGAQVHNVEFKLLDVIRFPLTVLYLGTAHLLAPELVLV